MPNFKLSEEDFAKAFKRLNEILIDKKVVMEVRAIGGYAMLRNHLRENGFSEDVDSATKDWSQEIINAIKQVAKEQNLLEDWLNNEPMRLKEVNEVLDQIIWLEDGNYSNINLYWADVDSTFLLKVRAFEGGGLVPRKTDKMDLFGIVFKLENINSFDSLIYHYPFVLDYPRCAAFLQTYEWQ